MPQFRIESEDGRVITLEGDAAPSPDEIDEIFQNVPQQQAKPDPMGMDSMRLRPQLPEFTDKLPSLPQSSPMRSAPDILERPTGIFDPNEVARQESESERMLHASPVPSFPEGKTITEKTGLPRAAAVPVSAVGKLITGVGQFFTSPAGASEAAVAATPAAPAMLLKWGYDMLKSAKDSLGDLKKIPADMVHQTVADLMRRNVQGSPLPDEFKQDFYQRGADDLVNVLALGFGGAKAGKHGIKGVLEAPGQMRKRAESLGLEGEMRDVVRNTENQPLPDVDAAASLRLGLPPRATPEMLPELQRTRDLVDQAIQEATKKIHTPGPKALDLLKAQGNEVVPATAPKEFRPGGGEAIGGRVSFNRPAEEMAVGNTKEVSNAIQQEGARVLQSLREEPIQGQKEVPQESGRSKNDEGGGEAPLNPGGSEASLPPEQRAISQKNNSLRAFAEANGVPFVEGDTQQTIFAKISQKSQVPPKTMDKGVAIEAKDHPEIAAQHPELLPQIVKDEVKLDKDAYKGEKKPTLSTEAKEQGTSPGQSNPIVREQTAAPVTPEFNWDLYNEDLRGDLESFSPARSTGVINYDLMDAGDRFVEFAKSKPESMPWSEILKEFSKTDEAIASQIKKVRESVKNIEAKYPRGKSVIDQAISNIESAQNKLRGSGSNLRMGVPHAVLDMALETVRLSLKAGKSIAEAIEAAVKKVRYNFREFNEKSLREELNRVVSAEGQAKRETSAAPKSVASAEKPAATKSQDVAKAGGENKTQPRVEGGEVRTRKSAERATTSDQIPEPVQQKIANAEESKYSSQPFNDMKDEVGKMTDAELASTNPKSNIYVASKLELANRLFSSGKLEEGYRVFMDVSKQGTDFGQNINQFKLLNSASPLNIVKLVNEGLKDSKRDPLTKPQMEELARIADESMTADRALDKAKREWQQDPTDANAKKADNALKASDEAALKLQRKMNGYRVKTWPQILKTFAQGNPLTPISHVANTIGNIVGAGMEQSSRGYGSLIDMVRATLTGTGRKLSSRPITGTIEAAKGLGRGLAQAPGIIARGSGDIVKGESRAQLQPLRALVKAFAKNPDIPTAGGKVGFNDRLKLAVEGTFGVAPETMLRLLSAADRPAYNAARARLIAEQMKLQKKPASQMAMAQKFPELFFDKDTLKRINDESADAVFQRPSKSVRYLQSLINEKFGDWGDLAFTILVAPYKLTPWNLVVRTLQYNPLLAMAKTAYEAKRGNVRQAELSAGRMVLGTILYGAGYFLYKNGLIGPSLEGQDEAQKARLLANEILPPNHVNISGLQRLARGESPNFKPGDETVDLTKGGGAAGAVLVSMANIGRDAEKQPNPESSELVQSLLKNSVLEQANFTINQSFLKGVTGVLDAITKRKIDPYISSVESMLLNIPTPNTLSTMSRATRQYVPEIKDSTIKKAIADRFGILGVDDYLPAKRGLWGEPLKATPENRNAILYHFFDIGKNREISSDPVANELYRLWRTTANNSVIPSIPDRNVTWNRETYPLNDSQYSELSKLVGENRRWIVDMMFRGGNFGKIPDEAKIKLLDSAYREGAELGKTLFMIKHDKELHAKPNRAGFTFPK